MRAGLSSKSERVLVLAGDPRRAAALAGLARPGCDVTVAIAGGSGAGGGGAAGLPSPEGYDAVVADRLAFVDSEPAEGAEGTAWVAGLQAAVENGACLLAIVPTAGHEIGHATPTGAGSAWWELLGARPVEARPASECYAKTGFGVDELTARVPAEFALSDCVVTLAGNGDSYPVLSVNIAYSDRPVMLSRRLGEGRVVTSGLGQTDEALWHTEVRTILRRALTPPGRAGSTGEIGFGVLGYGPYGGMGLYHGRAAQATAGLLFVAACDSDSGRRKVAEAEFPGLRAYDGVHDLVTDEEVGLVVVATPPSTHYSLALELLEAGKHVVIEKPMCLTVAEADKLIAAASAGGLCLTVHQSRRFDADYVAVKRCVDRGLLGDVFNVETFVGTYEHPCRAWHSETSISGGAVYDWGSHHLDWILQLMGGFPARLTAHGHKRVWHDVTNLDQVRVRLAWADGREAEFLQSDIAAIRRPKFYVQGTKGTLAGHYRPVVFERIEPGLGYVSETAHYAEAPATLRYARYEPGIGLSETVMPGADMPPYSFHRNLVDHLQFGEALAVEPDSVRRVVALLESAKKSTDEGNVTVDLPDL
ncbi:MAG: Gfo/Idh/MocA family oxidoreductase [Acidimicrobiales bacterium]